MNLIKPIHNLLFPVRNLCYFCREYYDNIDNLICGTCKEYLEFLDREINLESNYIERVYYSLLYNRYIRDLIKDFKFNRKSYLYKPFGEIMIGTIIKQEISNIDLIIYIPSHRRKEAIRGYNQSRLLAQFISKSLNIPISHNNLVKIKHTREQSGLARYERQINLKDAFKLKDRKEVYGKRILLIDDIITTGSTMIEAAKILIKNEAREIRGLALTSSKPL